MNTFSISQNELPPQILAHTHTHTYTTANNSNTLITLHFFAHLIDYWKLSKKYRGSSEKREKKTRKLSDSEAFHKDFLH